MLARRAPLLISIGLISLGCSKTQSNEPAWPNQPSPSYPSGGQAHTGNGSSTTGPTKVNDSQPPARPSTLAKQYTGKEASDTYEGKATYYADSLAGNHTANGDVYDPGEFTAAHKKLPFGTVLRVVRLDTQATTYVRVNDRGPFGPANRIIDLSKAAARELDMIKAGVVPVRIEVVELPNKR